MRYPVALAHRCHYIAPYIRLKLAAWDRYYSSIDNAVDSMPNSRPASDASVPPSGVTRVLKLVPAFYSLCHYSPQFLRRDVLAGLTVAAVAVPQAMAYAVSSACRRTGLIHRYRDDGRWALFASSKQLINGPTNAISIAMLKRLASVPAELRIQAAILMAALIGIIQTGITLMRLGDLSRFISHAVVVGFTVGASILLVLDQLKNFLGLKAVGSHHDHFLTRFLT